MTRKSILPTIKRHMAVTLIELLIAISLLALVILAGSGIYLSSWTIFRDAMLSAQAPRNALIPMTYITKDIQNAVPFNGDPNTLWNRANGTYPNLMLRIDSGTPSVFTDDDQIIYNLNSTSNQLLRTLIPRPAGTNTNTVVGTFISSSSFTYGGNSPTVYIIINATDNNGNNTYTLNSTVTSRYMPGQ